MASSIVLSSPQNSTSFVSTSINSSLSLPMSLSTAESTRRRRTNSSTSSSRTRTRSTSSSSRSSTPGPKSRNSSRTKSSESSYSFREMNKRVKLMLKYIDQLTKQELMELSITKSGSEQDSETKGKLEELRSAIYNFQDKYGELK